MTVILASLPLDLWHGLLLPRRMNEYLLYCLPCVSSTPLYQQRDIGKEKEILGWGGMRARDRCKYPLSVEPC